MMRTFTIFICLLVISGTSLSAQRVLLLERTGQTKSDRLSEGDELTFRMRGDKFWQQGLISELRPDIQAMVINDRYIMLEEVDALKFSGSRFANGVGLSLITFGVGWSAFAVVGYNTDGNPETNYGQFDLAVTLTAVGTGFLLRRLFASRKFRLNKRRRLRVVDLTF